LGHFLRSWRRWTSFVIVFVTLASLSLSAQRTVTKDAGAGAKEEMDYDARGRIVGSRTIGADGKLMVKMDYGYNTLAEVVTQTHTSYWPDGKSVQKVAQTTFDDSTNLISEIVKDFNQSGKHVSGHELFHDSMTGIYRCFDWNAAQQKHVAIDCPESEESHGGPHETPKITREEVMQNLTAARQAAQGEAKSLRVKPKGPVQVPITTSNKTLGVVLPARLRPGQRVSGRVVDDPDRFDGHPELIVARVTLPMPTTGDASQLSGWTFEWKPSEPQPADGAISFVAPKASGPQEFTLRQAGDPAIAVVGKVQFPKATSKGARSTNSFESPALCFKRDVCVVTGRFSGDSLNTFASFGRVPARIVAETESAAYIDVPAFMNLGPATLIVAEGKKVEAMTMVVAELGLEPNHAATRAGQNAVTTLHLDGVQELSDDQWHYGVYPPSSLEKARALVPGFNPAKVVEQERERREKQEKQDGMKKKDDKKEESAGMVLVVVNNTNPDVASMRAAKQQSFVFHLAPESFAMGEFKYNIGVDGLKDGTYVLKATAVPFLAPVKAQEFDAGATASKN
jgi:hypothetical protein